MEGFTNTNTPEDVVPETEKGMTDITVQPNENIQGLSEEERNDVNKIRITICEKTAPVIVFFGPASCGKTMTLVRLSRFLQKQGYELIPDRSFRPSYDKNYKNLCDNFSKIVNSDDAASRTDNISFMLVKVFKNGRTI